MAGYILFVVLISANTISGLFLPPGFFTQLPTDRVQDSRIGRPLPAPAPIWTLWDLASSSGSVITRAKTSADSDYHYDFIIGEKEDKIFMAHDETSDRGVVTGSYSYVDPLGALITVRYIADADGYRETRTSEPGFV